MQEDKLTDFERAEYYKQRLKTIKYRIIVYCALWFGLGVVAARMFYIWYYEYRH